MQVGMIGLGRMGAAMVRRLVGGGHACVVHDVHASAIAATLQPGVVGAATLADLVARLSKPRGGGLVVPAAAVAGDLARQIRAVLQEPVDAPRQVGQLEQRRDL